MHCYNSSWQILFYQSNLQIFLLISKCKWTLVAEPPEKILKTLSLCENITNPIAVIFST